MKTKQAVVMLALTGLVAGAPPLRAESVLESFSEEQAEHATPIANPLEKIDLYRQPHVPQPTAADEAMSCLQLEHEIRALQPQTYSYKPGFYEDPTQGAAIWVGSTMFWPALGVVAWGGYYEYAEGGRKVTAENRLSELRLLKAEKHCFEE